MLPNENYKENMEFLKKNLDIMLQGKEIDYECPFCKQVERIKILSANQAKCLKCENEFTIKIRLHVDA